MSADVCAYLPNSGPKKNTDDMTGLNFVDHAQKRLRGIKRGSFAHLLGIVVSLLLLGQIGNKILRDFLSAE